jgi:hypothetical protein
MHASAPNDLRRAKQIACWGGVAIVVIVYAVLVPMKWHGLLPVKMTWIKVVLGPVFLAGLPPLALFLNGTKKSLFWFSTWLFLAVAVMILDSVLADIIH